MRRTTVLLAALALCASLAWPSTGNAYVSLVASAGRVRYTSTPTSDPDQYVLSGWWFQGTLTTSKTFVGVFHGTPTTEAFDPRGFAEIMPFTIYGTGRDGTALNGTCFGGRNFATMDPFYGDTGIIPHTHLSCSVQLGNQPAQNVTLALDSGLYFTDVLPFPLPV